MAKSCLEAPFFVEKYDPPVPQVLLFPAQYGLYQLLFHLYLYFLVCKKHFMSHYYQFPVLGLVIEGSFQL